MRIAYIILSCKEYELTRLPWQKATIFKNVDPKDIYYLGSRMDEENRLYWWGAKDDYLSLPYKVVDFFRYSELDYDWYFLMDDDTFVLTDRLQRHVDSLTVNAQEELYSEGYILTHLAHTEWGAYYSGGAGTLFTTAMYHALKEKVKTFPNDYETPHWCADITLALWINEIPNTVMKHDDNYHYDRANEYKDNLTDALTFHHLNKRDDFIWHHHLLYVKPNENK
jgi:hypothetical protein